MTARELDLNSHGMYGTIPDSIGNMTTLTYDLSLVGLMVLAHVGLLIKLDVPLS